MQPSRLAQAAIMLLFCACSDPQVNIPPPVPENLEPDRGHISLPHQVTLTGSNFIAFAALNVEGDETIIIDDVFDIVLTSPSESVNLTGVEHHGVSEIRAWVPKDIEVGAYDLTMTTPYDLTGSLPGAYTAFDKWPPEIIGVDPSVVINDADENFTVHGENFYSGLTLFVGENEIDVTQIESGRVIAVIHSGFAEGLHDVEVFTDGGTASLLDAVEVLGPALVRGTLQTLSNTVPAGTQLELTLTLENQGGSVVDFLQPSVELVDGDGSARILSPHPPSVSLVPSVPRNFTWTIEAQLPGQVVFEASAEGSNRYSGRPVVNSELIFLSLYINPCDAQDCHNPTPICPPDGICRACENDTECQDLGQGFLRCDLTTGSCVPCIGDEDCGIPWPFCGPDSTCVQCLIADNCFDDNNCTNDECIDSACVITNNSASCDDGLYCNGMDTCALGLCTHAGNPCLSGPECADVCDEFNGTCNRPAGTPCSDDGLYCTGTERCDGDGSCVSSGDPCPGDDCTTCNEAAPHCFTPADTPCTDNGLFCDGPERCDGAGMCLGEGNPCPVPGDCDENNDLCGECGDGVVSADEECDPGVLQGDHCCNVGNCRWIQAGDADPQGVCSGAPECQSDVCDGAGGCTTANLPDGTPCTDDGEPCTDDECDGLGACGHPPNLDPCDDGEYCNGIDSCANGSCSAHTGDPCGAGPECSDFCDEQTDSCDLPAGTPCTDDTNPCTDDLCDGLGACTHPANTAPCDDGLFCNGIDTCSGGTCNHSGDPCAGGPECSDTCNEAADSCGLPDGTACSEDGDPCTTSESCQSGVCESGPQDKDLDGDGHIDEQCGGDDCDDDPGAGACGNLCSPSLAESIAEGNCADGYDNDCDGMTDTDPECAAGVIVVTTTSDDSDGNTASIAHLIADPGGDGEISLREAIQATNGTPNQGAPDEIHFQILDPLVSGAHTIALSGSFIPITDAVIINGSTDLDYTGTPVIELYTNSASLPAVLLTNGSDGSTVRDLALKGDGNGVHVGSDGNLVTGCHIGVDVSGTVPTGIQVGVLISGSNNNRIIGNFIGGASTRAIDASNGGGSTIIQGNYIGTNLSGANLGNQRGIVFWRDHTGSLVGGTQAGDGNVIAYNSQNGIQLREGVTGHTMLGNLIYANGWQNIDLGSDGATANDPGDGDTGENNLQNYPELSLVTTDGSTVNINGSLNSTADTEFRIEFFANVANDRAGERYVGSTTVITDPAGDASFTEAFVVSVSAGEYLTATATVILAPDSYGDTSEFSAPVLVGGGAGEIVVVTTTSDEVDGPTSSIAELIADPGLDGEISLREAVQATNNTLNVGGPDRIHFSIDEPLVAGAHTILHAGAAFLQVQGRAIIDGTTEPDYIDQPVIVVDSNGHNIPCLVLANGSAGSTIRSLAFTGVSYGISLESDDNLITECHIGVDVTGTFSTGVADGVYINGTNNNRIIGNIIGGASGRGITFSWGNSTIIQGNYIGTNPDGDNLGNDRGIHLWINHQDSLVGGTQAGQGNIIAYNTQYGIQLNSSVTGHSMLGNLIYANGTQNIELGSDGPTPNDPGDVDFGDNNLQNYPELTIASTDGNTVNVDGTLNSTADTEFRLEFFASGTNDRAAQTYVGSITVITDPVGDASFSESFSVSVPSGDYITATATVVLGADSYGDTSEISAPLQAL